MNVLLALTLLINYVAMAAALGSNHSCMKNMATPTASPKGNEEEAQILRNFLAPCILLGRRRNRRESVTIVQNSNFAQSQSNEDRCDSIRPTRETTATITPPAHSLQSAGRIACAMNSVEFLQELLSRKNTKDVTFYTTPVSDSDGQVDNDVGSLQSNALTTNTVCEYIGKLWFMRKKGGIKFKETVRVFDMQPSGSSASIECKTEYHNGKRWKNCAATICHIKSQNDNMGVEMNVESEVLVWLPMPKAGGRAVGKKITSTFQSAALAFLDGLPNNENK